jgi:hypothetical protein
MSGIKQDSNYIKELFLSVGPTVFAVLGIGIFYIISMYYIDHAAFKFAYIMLFLSVAKSGVIAHLTLSKVSKLINTCHSLNNLIWTFSFLIIISLTSFATDYTCLFQTNTVSFEGLIHYSDSYLYNLYQFFYFSTTTFSTVGFGDISPVSDAAKFVVLLEIFLSFLIIVFSLANIKKTTHR